VTLGYASSRDRSSRDRDLSRDAATAPAICSPRPQCPAVNGGSRQADLIGRWQEYRSSGHPSAIKAAYRGDRAAAKFFQSNGSDRFWKPAASTQASVSASQYRPRARRLNKPP